MTRRNLSVFVGIGVAWLAITTLAISANGVRTAWDGVYTEGQATRGRAVYMDNCAPCHTEDLRGFSTAPSLVGAGFSRMWHNTSVGEMLVRTRTLMPCDRPNGLSTKTYLDIIAFILKSNAYPPGEKELDGELEALQQILITAARPDRTRR